MVDHSHELVSEILVGVEQLVLDWETVAVKVTMNEIILVSIVDRLGGVYVLA